MAAPGSYSGNIELEDSSGSSQYDHVIFLLVIVGGPLNLSKIATILNVVINSSICGSSCL